MMNRDDYLKSCQQGDCKLFDMQDLADRFTGGYNSAPMLPAGANFVVSEHGGLVDTCKATCPPARPQLNPEFNSRSSPAPDLSSPPQPTSTPDFNKKN